jgi:hypothetical protein
MNEWTFDAVTRWTADALDRRSVFALLSGAVLAGTALPFVASAKDNHKKDNNKKDRRKLRKMCKHDYRTCKSRATSYCDTYYSPPQSDQCKADIFVCCKYYKKCSRKDYKKGNQCNKAIPWSGGSFSASTQTMAS